MAEVPTFSTYLEFWPYYVAEHRHGVSRALHVTGTGLVLGLAAWAAIAREPMWCLALPVCGYGFAWLGHFAFERNRPATFTYPLWSLRGDFQLFFFTLMGRMAGELARAEALYPRPVVADRGTPHAS